MLAPHLLARKDRLPRVGLFHSLQTEVEGGRCGSSFFPGFRTFSTVTEPPILDCELEQRREELVQSEVFLICQKPLFLRGLFSAQ
jgi:hypothetical protein